MNSNGSVTMRQPAGSVVLSRTAVSDYWELLVMCRSKLCFGHKLFSRSGSFSLLVLVADALMAEW